MSRNPLHALDRLRRFEVDAARRQLAIGLRAMAEAEAVHRAADAVIAHEAAVAADPATRAAVAAAFSDWQPHGRRLSGAARAVYKAAEQEAVRARAAVVAARAAAEAVEAMLAEQAAAGRAAALRAEQATLDEHGGRAKSARPSAQ